MRAGMLEREERQLDCGHAVQIAMGVVSADGQQIIAFAELVYPKLTTELEAFVAYSVPELEPSNGMLVVQLQVFGFPVASAENELFQKSHLLEGVGCEAVRPGHVQDLLDGG